MFRSLLGAHHFSLRLPIDVTFDLPPLSELDKYALELRLHLVRAYRQAKSTLVYNREGRKDIMINCVMGSLQGR